MNHTATFNLLLAVTGGPAVIALVAVVTRHLAEGHSKQHGRHLAAAARMAVEAAEQDVIARRAATRPKELVR